MKTQRRVTDEMIEDIVLKATARTNATKSGKYHLIKHDIGFAYHQQIILSASSNKTTQMSKAYQVADNCLRADEDYPMTKTSLQVDLNQPFKATIIIREY